jgi:uncharacterized membrane protein
MLNDNFSVLLALLVLIFFSDKLANTRFGKGLGAAIIVIILGAIAANLNLIPSASNSIQLYSVIFHYIAPLSIFYLTLGVNLAKIKKAGLPMLTLFVLGSLGTVVGVFIADLIVQPETVINELAAPIGGMFAGTYTGGSINFNAVALHYQVNESGVLYAGSVAVDNMYTAIWILATLAIPKTLQRIWPGEKIALKTNTKTSDQLDNILSLNSLIILLPLGLAAFALADWVSSVVPAIPSMLVITTIGLILAQIPYFHRLQGSHAIGLFMVLLFLVVIGAYCEIAAVHQLGDIGLTLTLFVGIIIVIHGLIIIGIGKLLVNDWDMIAIASQANIGGGATAMALAENFQRRELIVPAILVGTLGSALGTYLGFMVAGVL